MRQTLTENNSTEWACWFVATGDVPSVAAETGLSGLLQDMVSGGQIGF